jgi:hypothetical protein
MTEEQATNYRQLTSLLELCCKQASGSLDGKEISELPRGLQGIIRVEAQDLIEDLES